MFPFYTPFHLFVFSFGIFFFNFIFMRSHSFLVLVIATMSSQVHAVVKRDASYPYLGDEYNIPPTSQYETCDTPSEMMGEYDSPFYLLPEKYESNTSVYYPSVKCGKSSNKVPYSTPSYKPTHVSYNYAPSAPASYPTRHPVYSSESSPVYSPTPIYSSLSYTSGTASSATSTYTSSTTYKPVATQSTSSAPHGVEIPPVSWMFRIMVGAIRVMVGFYRLQINM